MTDTDTDISDELVPSTPELLREQALREIKKRRDFRTHLFIYGTTNVLLWGLWLLIALTTSGAWFPWPAFVTAGWGIGVVANAWDVYVRRPITEEEVDEEMERLRHRSHGGPGALGAGGR